MSGRAWTWLSQAGIVYFSYKLVGNLREGDVWGAVGCGLLVLTGVAFRVMELTPNRRRLTNFAGVVGGLSFGAVCSLAAALLTSEAVHASGAQRVLFAIGAGFLYLLAALMLFAAIVGLRRRARDGATNEANGNGEDGPHHPDSPSAESQHNPHDHK